MSAVVVLGIAALCAACDDDDNDVTPKQDSSTSDDDWCNILTGNCTDATSTLDASQDASVVDAHVCGTGEPLEIPSSVKIATYNLQNLFDAIDDPDVEENEFTPSSSWNESSVVNRLEHLSRVISDLNADIIAINEAENLEILTRLRNQIAADGGPNYPYIALAPGKGGKARGIDVSLMSRFPLICPYAECATGCSRPINMTFECLGESGWLTVTSSIYTEAKPILHTEVDFDNDGKGDIIFLANHWKAKNENSWPCLDSNDNHRRAGQQIRGLVDDLIAEDPTRPVFILGDLNSYEFDPALRTDLQARLDLDSLTMPSELYNTWGEIGVTEAHTTNSNSWNNIDNSSYYYNIEREWIRLDHIIVTANIRPNGGESDWRLKRGSTATFHPNYLLTNGSPSEFSISKQDGYSDHLAVSIQLNHVSK